MWLILFWLVCSIAVIAERSVYLFGASINKEVFLATMQKCILAGDIAKAVKMCSAANAPFTLNRQPTTIKPVHVNRAFIFIPPSLELVSLSTTSVQSAE